jgi:DNA-binding transcriptional ArsR family regulator
MSNEKTEDPGTRAGAELRQLRDVRTIRALAHPVRIALIEVLSVYGPMTATEAGERIGESPTTCSFHLRQLARYGFVEEAGGGKGRARPWKMTSIGMTIPTTGEDAETEIAVATLTRLFRERQLARYQTWLETRSMYPVRWRKAVGDSDHVFWVTAEELEALNEELLSLLVPRFRERLTDPALRPDGALPVELLTFTFPVAPPSEGRR